MHCFISKNLVKVKRGIPYVPFLLHTKYGLVYYHIFDDLPLFAVYFCLKICPCSAVAISRFLNLFCLKCISSSYILQHNDGIGLVI